MVKEALMIGETKSNRTEVPIKNKYLFTIREVGAYLDLGTKHMRRMAEANKDEFTIFISNKYMIT